MWDEGERSSPYPTSFLRVLGVTLVVLAVGLMVVGVLLLVTCAARTITTPFPPTVGCAYPYEGTGAIFLYAATLVAIAAGNLFARTLEPVPTPKAVTERRYVITALVTVVATVLLVVALLFLGKL